MKRCTECKEEKELTEFHIRRISPDGLAYKCKDCVRIISAKWRNRTEEDWEPYRRHDGMSYCSKCAQDKRISEFSKDNKRSDGLKNTCKNCDKEHNKEYHKTRRRYERKEDGEKTCAKCGEEKDVAEFHKDFRLVDGLSSQCVPCLSIKGKNAYYRRKAFTDEKREQYRRPDGMKRCPLCKKDKELTEFHVNRSSRDGLHYNCKACTNLNKTLRTYNLTKDDYYTILQQQDNKCAICKIDFESTRVFIDHNHDTGDVRAMLCNGCNAGLGQFKESIETLKSAIEYLETSFRIEAV